jgi:hypothetical protein
MRVGAISVAIGLVVATSATAVDLPKDVTTADVCAVISGAEVARALGGTLTEALLVRPGGDHARCRYTVNTEAGEPAVVIVWLHAAGDFDDLRAVFEDPVTPVEGLGDAAFVAVDPESARHDLFVLLRGVATVEVTGPSAAGVRAVAEVAVRAVRR